MYNFYGNSKFKVGDKVRANMGVDSGRKATVINHFRHEDGYVRHLANDSNWIPIRWDNGVKDYMGGAFLTKLR